MGHGVQVEVRGQLSEIRSLHLQALGLNSGVLLPMEPSHIPNIYALSSPLSKFRGAHLLAGSTL